MYTTDLLINSATGGSPYIVTFFWATSIFIFIASASKLWLYVAVFKNFALKSTKEVKRHRKMDIVYMYDVVC